jgi:hypothetical protein
MIKELLKDFLWVPYSSGPAQDDTDIDSKHHALEPVL